jgi:hypothetical protein
MFATHLFRMAADNADMLHLPQRPTIRFTMSFITRRSRPSFAFYRQEARRWLA